MNFANWKEIPEPERREIARRWSPYDTSDIDVLLEEILAAFRDKYSDLDVPSMGNVHSSLMIVVMHPFIHDNRIGPEYFMGLPVHYTLTEPVPEGFKIYQRYIWAPENYLNFVDGHAAEIRRELGDPGLTREDMLAALVGMPFDQWIEQCRKFGPGHTNMVPGQRTLGSES